MGPKGSYVTSWTVSGRNVFGAVHSERYIHFLSTKYTKYYEYCIFLVFL
jgi:hypothetical protein